MYDNAQSPSAVRRRVRFMAAGLSITIWAVYVLWRKDDLMTLPKMAYVPTNATSLPFAVVLGYGMACILGLLHANRYRLRAVFRPNLGRILGTMALIFVTPFDLMNWFPWIVGGLMLVTVSAPLYLLVVMIKAWPLALWYIPACLIISGTKSKWLRFGLFCLMFWSAYSALVLMFGVHDWTGF